MIFKTVKKKGNFSYFQQKEEKRENLLFNKRMKIGKFPYKFKIGKKGFNKGNFISPFSKPFWRRPEKYEKRKLKL